MRDFEKQIMAALKNKARGVGLTQGKIAADLNVSLPTIKRWWAGKGVSLSNLQKLCHLLGITLSQLLLEVEGGEATYTYTLAQEKALVANPRALALFDLLIGGETIPLVQRRYKLTDHSISVLLLFLDRIGLIELFPKNKFKLVQKGEPQWISGGPLSQTYRKKMIDGLLGIHDKKDSTFYIHSYLPDDLVLLKGKLKEIDNLLLACNARAIHRPEETISYGFYRCFKPFEWNLRSELGAS